MLAAQSPFMFILNSIQVPCLRYQTRTVRRWATHSINAPETCEYHRINDRIYRDNISQYRTSGKRQDIARYWQAGEMVVLKKASDDTGTSTGV